jgi:hypothetical protein
MESEYRKKILLALLIGALALAFWGCNLLGISIEDRVDEFIADLNGDWNLLYENFHPTETAFYNAIKPATFWEDYFEPTPPSYTISGLDTTDPANVTFMIDGPALFLGPRTVTFQMVQSGSDWYIEEMDLSGYGNIVQ